MLRIAMRLQKYTGSNVTATVQKALLLLFSWKGNHPLLQEEWETDRLLFGVQETSPCC